MNLRYEMEFLVRMEYKDSILNEEKYGVIYTY